MNEPQLAPDPNAESERHSIPLLSFESLPPPDSEEKQAEYLAAYRLQLRRMACPGCGDGEPSF